MINRGLDSSRLARTGRWITTLFRTRLPFGSVYSITAATNGDVLVAGSIRINGNSRDTFGVFNALGSFNLAVNFNSTGKGGTRSIAVQPDGKILVAGVFTRANGLGRNRIARFNPDGTLDGLFNSASIMGSSISAMYLQPDGKILIGGGTVTRLNSDGSIDASLHNQAAFHLVSLNRSPCSPMAKY